MNNKGMAISSILYTILVLFLVLLFGILGLISSAKTTFDALKNKLYADLNERPPQLLYVDDDGGDITFKVLSKKYIDSYYVTETQDNLTLDQFNNLKTDLTDPLEKFNITYQIPSSYGNYIYLRSIHSVLYKYYVQIDNSTSTTKVTIVPVTEHTVLEINKFPVVFKQEGACIFDGVSNITGDNCTKYSNKKYIDTGIALFSADNISKDFDLTLNIDAYDENETTKTVVIGNMLEQSDTGQSGILFRRRSKTNYELIVRKNALVNDSNYLKIFTLSISKIRIIRKNGKICYSTNNGSLTNAIYDFSDIPQDKLFNTPLLIGADFSEQEEPRRFFKGTISNIELKLGKDVDNTLTCEEEQEE